MELTRLDTEQRNPRTEDIDRLPTLEMVELINEEDGKCAFAVRKVLPEIAKCIDITAERLSQGGRLFYAGAGTSGRLGVLDASECPPTYGVDEGLVVGLIAGGRDALVRSSEHSEDKPEMGAVDLASHGFGPEDVLIGLAASGRTPYVLGAMDYARQTGAAVFALVCCRNSEMEKHADLTIAPLPGPEVVTGSSRMKSGTCQKMVLNMISTGVMIRLGKVYGNLMVDVRATNEKLRNRARSIVMTVTGVDPDTAGAALEACGGSCKTAIVMLLLHVDRKEAEARLEAASGRIRDVMTGG